MILNRMRKPKETDYILAYLLKGSVTSLNNYINNHPRGKDAARRDIIDIKYALSCCSPLIQTLLLKMFNKMDKFDVGIDSMFGGEYTEYYAKDMSLMFKFQCQKNDKNHIIELDDGTKISNSNVDYIMFIFAVKGIEYINDNIGRFEKEQLHLKTRQKVMEAYQ